MTISDVSLESEMTASMMNDPPPPYPSRSRRIRGSRRSRRSNQPTDSAAPSPELPNETTPFLTRPRSLSHVSLLSSISGSPLSGQTMVTMFDGADQHNQDDGCALPQAPSSYFRPLKKKVYYMSLFHLAVINFPYTLLTWIFLFVFTLLGTTLLVALPLGLLLCFIDLLVARVLARGELYLQTKFHFPQTSLRRKPVIFTRQRSPSREDIESTPLTTNILLDETSFYKNTYAMFTDPTSYHSLFYFLVIKPPITLLFSLFIVICVLPCLILVIPAPAALRAVRRMGMWQAAVALEGLAGEA
ncbi:uncharacterized protein BT62DRAFT_922564 [Guyanagaster necrorhizus]|uniref:Sensor domain-containing protein n=1 Tax=Guyanagaster necrorhizus TaxID=856835 RepID=A0A9P7VK72_9AGAR|nr:uncharacterized protein BT62DRAFT_922564 [Guyanagaster necrorhizus MCA 3950]KAG7442636.1 hypothetical protein BT62DRAFT_922564 [Guyanagaster necrorhizus MCA 3950]